jgi:hypothetical protein
MISSGPTPTIEEKRAALTLALTSHTFARSEQLKGFLKFVCEKAIAGEGDEINEYLIGVEVLGRPPDYSPNEDSAVRNRAYALRGKLEELYSRESPDAQVRIELPKGSYCPEFIGHEPPPLLMPSMTPESRPSKPESAPAFRLSWPSLLTGLLIGLLVAVAVWTARVLFSPAKLSGTLAATGDSPDLTELWKPFLRNDRPLIILFSSLQFYRYDSGFIRDLEMNNPARHETRVRELQAALKSSPLIPWNNFTTYGEVNGIFLLTRFLTQRGRELLLRRSSSLNWEEIGDHDVIFVGSLSSDPRLREIPVKWAFEVRANEIVNLNPLEGEPARYLSKISLAPGPLPQEGYTLISISPGLRGNGRFLMITAVNDPGRWAGAQYLTDERHVRELAAKLKGATNAMPQFFQIVIRSRFQSMVPVEISYVTHRRL